MYQTKIETLAANTLDALSANGFTARSLGEKRYMLQQIVRLHLKTGQTIFSPELLAVYVSNAAKRYDESKISKSRLNSITKTADYLTTFHDTGEVLLSHRDFSNVFTPYYENILHEILQSDMWDEKAKHSVRQFAMPYFKWLQSKGISDLSHVTEVTIREYLMDCSSRMKNSSLDATRRAVKKLYRFLFHKGHSSDDFGDVLMFSVPTEKKIKKPIPADEVARTLTAIDRHTPIGKRDYAIIILATVTGLRSVDIANLKLKDIDWACGEIRLEQEKTSRALALPLTTDVGTAIQDYLLCARQKCDLPYVFLRFKSPYAKLSSAIPYMVFNQYRRLAGLSRCGFHGLRRSLGTGMVVSGVPVTTVAQILGHSGLGTVKQYISLDSTHLKECALSPSCYDSATVCEADV